jgi:hypothetical protein
MKIDTLENVSALVYVNDVLNKLDKHEGKDWAYWFVEYLMDFSRKYTKGYLFSTRFGGSFFEEIQGYLTSNAFIEPEKGITLGEYDKNFNAWLKIHRKNYKI